MCFYVAHTLLISTTVFLYIFFCSTWLFVCLTAARCRRDPQKKICHFCEGLLYCTKTWTHCTKEQWQKKRSFRCFARTVTGCTAVKITTAWHPPKMMVCTVFSDMRNDKYLEMCRPTPSLHIDLHSFRRLWVTLIWTLSSVSLHSVSSWSF